MKNDALFKMNLQFFAEGNDGDNGAGADDGASAGRQGGNDGGSQGNQGNPAGDALPFHSNNKPIPFTWVPLGIFPQAVSEQI